MRKDFVNPHLIQKIKIYGTRKNTNIVYFDEVPEKVLFGFIIVRNGIQAGWRSYNVPSLIEDIEKNNNNLFFDHELNYFVNKAQVDIYLYNDYERLFFRTDEEANNFVEDLINVNNLDLVVIRDEK